MLYANPELWWIKSTSTMRMCARGVLVSVARVPKHVIIEFYERKSVSDVNLSLASVISETKSKKTSCSHFDFVSSGEARKRFWDGVAHKASKPYGVAPCPIIGLRKLKRIKPTRFQALLKICRVNVRISG